MRRWWFNQCILSLTNYWSKENWFIPAWDYLHLVFDKYWHDTTDLFQDHWLQTWHSPSWQCWCKSPGCSVWTPYIHWQSGWEAGFLNKNVIQKSSWNYTSNVLQWLSDICVMEVLNKKIFVSNDLFVLDQKLQIDILDKKSLF